MSETFRISIEGGAAFDCAGHENLVAAAERAGRALPASCRAGDVVAPGHNDDGDVRAYRTATSGCDAFAPSALAA